ncbi:hypothetical protein INR49_010796 [Caranx melampygus]|nr:hypothetical protein INR49_010796 [Caranx melampygus]
MALKAHFHREQHIDQPAQAYLPHGGTLHLRRQPLTALRSAVFQSKSSGAAMRSAAAFLIFLRCVGFIVCKASSPCPSGQFMLKSQCVLCHPTCSECDGHELFECTTCGVDEDGQERFLHQGRCRTHCPRGLYPDRGHYSCLPCIANCELCTDGNICAKCREHYKLQNGVCQTASCDIGQVQDPDTGECIDCEMGCKSCSAEDPEICNSCTEGYFLLASESPTGAETTCSNIICLPLQGFERGECIKQCPQQTYSDSSGWRCQPCHSSCETCHGPRSTDCDLCLGGSPSLHGQCPLVNCPLGQYFDGKYTECHTCDSSCKTCFGPQAQDCSSCFKGYFLDQDSSCVAQCPPGSYANTATQLCEDCSPNCEACMGTSDNCISCSKGSYKLFLHQGKCWSNCPEGFFETTEGSCETCDSSCLTCDAIKSQCLSCPDGYYLGNGMCRLNCSLRTYPADDGTCRRCPSHCDVCSDDRTCFSELSDFFLYLMLNGACKASCPMGYYEDMEEGRCGQCHPTCTSCSGPLADDCETCSTISPKLYKGTCSKDCLAGTYYETAAMECQDSTCVSECPAGTYDTRQEADGTELGFCLPCDRVCSTCTGASPRDCLTCSAGFLHLLHLCVAHCPTGYYKEGSRCEKCHQSCELCTGPGPESCRACPPPLLELQGTKLCVEHCPHRFYQLADVCKQCHTSCQSCIDASPQSCLTCDWGSTLKENVCYPRCEEGRYFSEEETCEPCDSSCRHCTGPRADQCLTCHHDSALHAVENRCARCCQARGNDTGCCLCDTRSALCVEAPQRKSGDDQVTDLNTSSTALKHTSAALPITLLLALGLALVVFALVKAHARKRLCWSQSYERLSGSASINMPHGVPEPDSGDEVDVVYTSRGGTVYRCYSFIHEQDTDADQDADESTCLNQS